MRLYRFILLIFFSILPFLALPGVYNPFEFPKFILTISVVQILIIIWVIYFTKSISYPLNRTMIILGLFLVLLFLANTFGLDPAVSFSGGAYRHQGFLFFLSISILFFMTYSLFSSDKKLVWHSFTKIALIQFFLLTLYALYHFIQFYFFQNYSIPLFQNRIVTTFGNPHFLAGYVLMLLPIAFVGLSSLPKLLEKKKIILQTLLIAFAAMTIYATDSKSTILAAVCMGFLWLASKEKTMKNTTLKKQFVPLLIAGALVSSAIILTTARYSIWDNRALIWESGIQSVIQHPFLGIGQENFQLIVQENYYTVDNAHNIFLEIAVAAGIPAIILFLAFSYQTMKKSPLPIQLSIVGFFICASFNPISIPQFVLFFLLLSFSKK